MNILPTELVNIITDYKEQLETSYKYRKVIYQINKNVIYRQINTYKNNVTELTIIRNNDLLKVNYGLYMGNPKKLQFVRITRINYESNFLHLKHKFKILNYK